LLATGRPNPATRRGSPTVANRIPQPSRAGRSGAHGLPMALALIHSRAQCGVDAPPVQVEVHLSGGLPGMSIVGLPEAAVRESKDRVRAALLCAQFEMPQRRITVNLAPADLPKDGARFDLPIALGILVASNQLPAEAVRDSEFIGELALTGELRRVQGALTAALAAGRSGRALVLPQDNAAEAALASTVRVLPAGSLLDVCAHLRGVTPLEQAVPPNEEAAASSDGANGLPDLIDVRGQAIARRALEIAAAGGHHLLLVGPPGSGKTLLASRLPGLLPPLDEAAALEAAAVRSLAAQRFEPARWRQPVFRHPHHTASGIALVGGGSPPRPGEISLAHHGVLFLDELPEWDRRVLEVLREPLESGRIHISRAAQQAEFPARFQLVAAMNPCPCGWAGDPSARCHCSAEQIARYRARISGPLLDRIDLIVEVPRLSAAELRGGGAAPESSARVAQRVAAARGRQQARGALNSQLAPAALEAATPLDAAAQALLDRAVDRLQLSARVAQRIRRVARSIADLHGDAEVDRGHLAEAIALRRVGLGATGGSLAPAA
jgi:magnesium chelatase family protein